MIRAPVLSADYAQRMAAVNGYGQKRFVMHITRMVSADTIKNTRQRLGETQAEFARRFGVDQCTISRWEAEGLPDRGPSKLIERAIRDLRPL